MDIIGLPRSTFYYKPKAKDHSELRRRILALYQENKGRDGYRMIRIKLQKEGVFLSGKTVLGHMRALGIRSCVKVKRGKKTGKTSHIAPNLLQRNFTATRLKEKWVTDVTELRVGREKLYLSPHDEPSQSGDYRLYDGTTPDVRLGFGNAEKDISPIKQDGFADYPH